nr:fumarylacetoacetate hydrolase family protein [Xenorhabdus sp. Flor]
MGSGVSRDCRRAGQWIYSKGQDTYAPFGPCIVTADDIPDPHNLALSLKVNGVTKQDSNICQMRKCLLITTYQPCLGRRYGY